MKFIDTHTHLFSDSFDEDRSEMIQRSISLGINTFLLPNIDISSIEKMHHLCSDFPNQCFPMMGLHPGSVGENWEKDLEVIQSHLFSGRKYVAVGEIGMDLYWDKTFQRQQEKVFRKQIAWAKELKLPIVIHAREAFEEIFSVLDDLADGSLTGVFHCFTGNAEQARKIMEYSTFKIGIGGVLTFKKSGLDEVVKEIPMEYLVLETDSPYLAPVPHRGKRNESAFLMLVADKLAEVKQLRIEEVAAITTSNAQELFNL
ncbi:MAG: TatD family hydrolase [Cryomorphaceae bacterium]|jgi:TatD DNase family protein|nr:TatD family hydrolase [Cryomorphaceae bacterium]